MSISTAATIAYHEFLKGTAGEAGKSAWLAVKHVLGWSADPPAADIKAKVEERLAVEPEMANRLLEILKASRNREVAEQVGQIVSYGGKITVIGSLSGGATFN